MNNKMTKFEFSILAILLVLAIIIGIAVALGIYNRLKTPEIQMIEARRLELLHAIEVDRARTLSPVVVAANGTLAAIAIFAAGGLAMALVIGAWRRAVTVYPNQAGLFPLVPDQFLTDYNHPTAQLVTAAGSWQPAQSYLQKSVTSELAPVSSDYDRPELPEPLAVTWPSRVPLSGLLNGHQASLTRLILGVTLDENGSSQVVSGDMSSLVHVAVGGSSGSGKSLFLRALAFQMIRSVEQPNLVLVDLEHVTFAPFERSERLLYPVTDTEADALVVFNALVAELDRRKAAFGRFPGCDSLEAYNRLACDELRAICILVDESTALLGDRDVQRACRTLALRARKYGLWLVLGGQDWKATSLDTAIRNQLGARIQFKAMSASQSRVLLERSGAEALDVPGRALCILPGRGLVKMQAPWISDAEIAGAVTGPGPQYELPESASNISTEIQAGDQAARIRELHAQGLSARQIEIEVFGYDGGKAHRTVKEVLQQECLY